MKTHLVSWPCGDVPFHETIRARFYLRRFWGEQLYWLGWIGLPLVLWAVGALSSKTLDPSTDGAPELFAVLLIGFAGTTWWIGWKFIWGSSARFLRHGHEATVAWRHSLASARQNTEALAKLVPLSDRSRDAFLRAAACSATESKLRYVYSLSAHADVSFSPRQFAGSAGTVGSLRSILTGQLLLELVRLGGDPIIFRDAGENLIAIWQLDEVVQFWAVLRVEPFGNELRVSEKTGYQWWIPWTARSRRLGLPVQRKFRNVTRGLWDDLAIFWPHFGFFTHPIAAFACSLAAILFPPVGLTLWTWRAVTAARMRERFMHWHSPEFGDSLDLALLQNERHLKPFKFTEWTVDNIVRPDGTPAYPDMLQRIDVMRELVGAAVTQAIEETINSSPLSMA